MTTCLTLGFLLALIGPGVIADSVEVDFPENVNSRLAGSRIVSGWEADLGQFPWLISMRMINPSGQVSACGGSVVHPWWLLTAAHCTAGRISFVIRAGLVNLTQPEYISEASRFWNHPRYNNALPSVVQLHDIGLLKLSTPVTFSQNLQPIRMQRSADMNTNYGGQRLVAGGWGLTWTQGTSPEVKNWVYLSGYTNFLCWVLYEFSSIIDDSTICAGYYNVTSQSTCQGDSGGSLSILEEDGIWTLIGVTSFVSSQGCHTELPGGFIRPGHYHDWFYEVTGINFDWDWEDSEESPELSSEESTPRSSSEESVPKSSEESAPRSSSEESVPKSSEESAPRSSSEESVPKSSEESAPRSSEESVPKSSEESAPRSSSDELVTRSSEESAPRSSSEESIPKSSEESAPRSSSEESVPKSSEESASRFSSEESVPKSSEEPAAPRSSSEESAQD